jgi:hypothetical protein
MFTERDAKTPLPSFARAAYATRRIKFDRNKSVEDDLTFWARFLSGGSPTINLGQDHVLDLVDAKVQSLFGDIRPDCIVVCLPDEVADLRVQNPGLSLTERRALELLQAQEEEEQLSLFQPSPEELKAAEELRTQADDLLFRTFYRALR